MKFNLGFSHPCKELIWISQIDKIKDGNIKDRFNYTNSFEYGVSLVKTSKILLNGQERSTNRDYYYYNHLVPYKYHSSSPENGINMYSFSINPNNVQPFGSCNLSKVDDIVLEMSVDKSITYNNPGSVKIFNSCYKTLRRRRQYSLRQLQALSLEQTIQLP